MKAIGGLIALAGVVLVGGCAGHGRVLDSLPTVDATQAGEIVVIRPRGLLCSPVSPVTVTLDGQDVHRLACDEHVIFAVPVGSRFIGLNLWTRPDTTAVTVTAGSRYHLRFAFLGCCLVLKHTTPEIGERLMRDTKRSY